MPDNDCLLDFELNERFVHQLSLSCRCPPPRPWSVRVTEARTIDGDDAISVGQPFEYSADLKILHHGAVAVQQDEGWSLTSLEIMEAEPFDIEEAAGRWVVPLRRTCTSSDHQSHSSQDGRRYSSSAERQPCVICQSRVTVHNFSKKSGRGHATNFAVVAKEPLWAGVPAAGAVPASAPRPQSPLLPRPPAMPLPAAPPGRSPASRAPVRAARCRAPASPRNGQTPPAGNAPAGTSTGRSRPEQSAHPAPSQQ